MTQYSRPSSTINRGSWSPSSNMHETIDEILADDSDASQAQDDGDGEPVTAILGMSAVTDPAGSIQHTIRTRAKTGGHGDLTLTIELVQPGSPDVTIATQTIALGTSTTYTDYDYTLSTSEANAITNYANLRINMIAVDSNEEDGETFVSHLFFAVPDAGGGGGGGGDDDRILTTAIMRGGFNRHWVGGFGS